MKNKIVVVVIIFLFIGLMVFASIFVNKFGVTFSDGYISGDIENNNLIEISGEVENSNLVEISEEEKEEKDMDVIKLTSENFEEEVLKSEKTVLIDFYADWCMPCKMMTPVIERVAIENKDIKVGKINIDAEEELAIKYQVMSIPTFIVIKNGQVVNRIVGVVDKSELEMAIKWVKNPKI